MIKPYFHRSPPQQDLLADQLLDIEKLIDSINKLSRQERKLLLLDFNATKADYPTDKSIVDLFHEQVLRNPDALALVFEDRELSYGELNARSNQLAHYLKRKGVKTETLVPICTEGGLEMVIGILGILKAGGAYVPIDPDCPSDRIKYILEDTKAKIVVCNGLNVFKKNSKARIIDIKRDSYFINREPRSNPGVKVSPRNLVYVIYTSGSTGNPKGVMVEHKSLVNYLSNSKARYINDRTENAGSFVHLSYTFDASLISMFTPLISGKYLVIGSNGPIEAFTDGNLEKYAPYDFITVTPSHLGLLTTVFKSPSGSLLTNRLLIGGEKLTSGHFDFFVKEGINIEIVNEYGPTEATIGSCSYNFYTLGDNRFIHNEVPIGKPISNIRIYILSEDGQLSPVGVNGEIFLGGAGLARGYLNLPKLTSELFIKDPFSPDSYRNEAGSRLYKTGDLGRWLPDGNIEYLGRMDDQVKIRGYRIEPGEIESVLNGSGLVQQGVVLAKGDSNENKCLVGYVVASEKFDKQAIQSYLGSKLPDYMIPALWVELDRMPLTSRGKIDRKALRDPELKDIIAEYVAPRNAMEATLTKKWQELLGLKRVGIYDNFFELGGNSLLAMQIVSFIRQELNIDLSFRDLFVHPSVDELARKLESENKTTLQLLIPIRATGNKTPLYIICGAGGTVFKFINFVKMLDPEQPVYGLQQPIDSRILQDFPDTIEGIARVYLKEILKQNPNGPYALTGHCLGGNIAFEMAQQLKDMGKEVAMLGMFEPYAAEEEEIIPATFKNYYKIPDFIKNSFSVISFKIKFELFLLLKHPKQNFRYKIEKAKSIFGIRKIKPGDVELDSFNKVSGVFEKAMQNYKMKHYEGEILVFYAKDHYYFGDWNNKIWYKKMYISDDTKNSWKKHAKSVKIYEIEGELSTIFDRQNAAEFAQILQSFLKNVNNVNDGTSRINVV